MSNLTSRFARRAVIGGVTVALAMAAATGSASAAGSVQIIGGTLAMTQPSVGDFTSVTLDGTNKSTTAAIGTFTATDPTGLGAGWKVTAAATQFCTGTITLGVCSGNSLSTGSLNHSAPASVSAGSGSNTVPTLTAVSGVDGGSGRIVSAAVGAGMGTYSVGASTLTLAIPASAYAGTYVSTLTYTISATP